MRRSFTRCVLFTLAATVLCAQEDPWPGQYRIQPWETDRLRPTDVIGPDGIVYPDARPAGVQGGIPTIDERYRRFDVTAPAYGADGSDSALDGDAVAAAVEDALAYLRAVEGRRACIFFPAGEYRFDDQLPVIGLDGKMPIRHLVFKGAGSERTTLRILESETRGALIRFWGDDDGPYLHMRENALRGSNRILTEEALPDDSYAVGEWIRIKPSQMPEDATMAERCNRPEAAVIYEAWHLGRTYFAKITARGERSLSIDHHLLHDLFADERPQIRRMHFIEYCGVEDLRIVTESADCKLDPIKFNFTANCWLRGVHIDHARNWPVEQSGGMTHMEYRDCHFDGTLSPINAGSRAYLGWTAFGGVSHCLMIDCRANDLRHMPIFQGAAGCVVTGSSFTGDTSLALQCHGAFPHDILVDDNFFDTPKHTVGIDGTHTLRHGLEGPRFVMHNNRVQGGPGTFDIRGGVEGHIYVYNRVRLDETKYQPLAVSLRDRSWDGIFRGNVVSVAERSPLFNIQDPTCVGWTITDNQVYGSNGRIWEGSSRPCLTAGNRFHPALADQDDLPAARPAVDSLYHWQLQHADDKRLLLVAPSRETAAGSSIKLVLLRVADDELPAISIRLEALSTGWAELGTIDVAAGEDVHHFQLPVPEALNGQVRLQVSADGYLADEEHFQVFDAFLPPDRGDPASDYPSDLPGELWRAGDFGQVTTPGDQRIDGDRITLRGNGLQYYNWNTTSRSGFHFAYQALAGDGGLIARLVSTDNADQAGIRWLDDEALVTQHLHLFSDGRTLAMPILSAFGNRETPAIPGLQPPIWLKLERRGALFSAFYSTSESEPDEDEWIAIDLDTAKDHDHLDYHLDPADPEYSDKPDDYKSRGVLDPIMYFGLFVNQDTGAELGTAVFEGVRFFGEVVPRGNPPGRQIGIQVQQGGNARLDLEIINLQDAGMGLRENEWYLFEGLPPDRDAVLDLLAPDVITKDG